jgi:uncharacterized integral membrane protein
MDEATTNDGFDEAGDSDEVENLDGPQAAAPEKLGIAWGFVAVLVLALVVAIFVFQNDNPIGVQFLSWNFGLYLWEMVIAIVLITIVADQVVSLNWRSRKRRKMAARAKKP